MLNVLQDIVHILNIQEQIIYLLKVSEMCPKIYSHM
jgi:hypothetical protein